MEYQKSVHFSNTSNLHAKSMVVFKDTIFNNRSICRKRKKAAFLLPFYV